MINVQHLHDFDDDEHTSKRLGKCQTLAMFSHKSMKIADLIDQLDKHISKFNITQWNTEYMLVKSILSIGRNDMDYSGRIDQAETAVTASLSQV